MMQAVAISPVPPGGSWLSMTWTSTDGISLIRNTG
jgi:hypothetical protein